MTYHHLGEETAKPSATIDCAHGVPMDKSCGACYDDEQGRGGGMKYDGGKQMWSLLMQGCASSVAGVVNILTFGAKKYAPHSWRTVPNGYDRYKDAMYRHLNAIENGEVYDSESGLPHWHHVLCNGHFCAELHKGEE